MHGRSMNDLASENMAVRGRGGKGEMGEGGVLSWACDFQKHRKA